MDIRRPINDTLEPAVLSVAFNEDTTRFICGLEDGIRIFRAKDCIRTVKHAPGDGKGIAIAETRDDRHITIVGGGRHSTLSPNKMEFRDCIDDMKLLELDLSEPVLGIRITEQDFVIILNQRVICMNYQVSSEHGRMAPTLRNALHRTSSNPYALCCISGDTMVLPGLTLGQAQILGLRDKRKRVVLAHDGALRNIALSKDGSILATASEKGTLIRVFSTATATKTHEFRRGLEKADIYGLAVSPSNHFVACTSDKGTLHVFDLRPRAAPESRPTPTTNRRGSNVKPATLPRPRPGSADLDDLSIFSGSSSPKGTAGFYGPPADLAHTPPAAGPSMFDTMKKIPGMPSAFSDARSMTSTPYHLGSDPPNWQGQPAHTFTTLPNGSRKKYPTPNAPIPGRPGGKPPKGIVAWDPEGGDRRLWVVGGGADARWEVFDLVEDQDGQRDIRVIKRGFRKYLTRQFPEEQ